VIRVRRSLRPAVWAAAATTLWSCAAPAPRSPAGVSAALAAFLPDPGPLAAAEESAALSTLHRRLMAAGGEPAARREVEVAAGSTPGPAARLLVAESALVGGEAERARAILAALPAEFAARDECRLVRARADEELAAWSDAVEGYRAAAGRYPEASVRAAALEDRAYDQIAAAVDEALARRRWVDADLQLARLAALRPGAEGTLERRLAVATASGNDVRELDALRSLVAMRSSRLDLRLRLGALEVELGDAAAGLGILQDLALRQPADPAVGAALQRAKFLFRLANAPEELRVLAQRPELRRGEYARLLYWLVPGLRTARGAGAPIAADILDDPARDEIVRVTGLGLLRVDRELHRFDPQRPVRRAEVFDSLAALVRLGGSTSEAEAGCSFALALELIREPAECLPGATVSGPEASEWIRVAAAHWHHEASEP